MNKCGDDVNDLSCSCRLQVIQARTAASYEKVALRINEWFVHQGYEPFGDECRAELEWEDRHS